MAIMETTEKFSLQTLKANDWNLEGAFDLSYCKTQIRSIPDSRYLEEVYQWYKDPYINMIMVDGINIITHISIVEEA
jgi:DCN1-like protein 1/2